MALHAEELAAKRRASKMPMLAISPKCHPDAGCAVEYTVKDAVLRLGCRQCLALVCEIRVARTPEFN